MSFSIPAGVITCLVGDSGSGKTTIADLVIGLIHPEAGVIRIDGHDLHALDVHAWRHSIGYVPQENLLLHDSILHNVALGDPSLKREDAESRAEARRRLGLHFAIAATASTASSANAARCCRAVNASAS